MLIKLRATATHPQHNEGTVYALEPVFAAADLYQHFAEEISQDTALTTRALTAAEPDSVALSAADKKRVQLQNLAKARAARKYERRDMKASD